MYNLKIRAGGQPSRAVSSASVSSSASTSALKLSTPLTISSSIDVSALSSALSAASSTPASSDLPHVLPVSKSKVSPLNGQSTNSAAASTNENSKDETERRERQAAKRARQKAAKAAASPSLLTASCVSDVPKDRSSPVSLKDSDAIQMTIGELKSLLSQSNHRLLKEVGKTLWNSNGSINQNKEKKQCEEIWNERFAQEQGTFIQSFVHQHGKELEQWKVKISTEK